MLSAASKARQHTIHSKCRHETFTRQEILPTEDQLSTSSALPVDDSGAICRVATPLAANDAGEMTSVLTTPQPIRRQFDDSCYVDIVRPVADTNKLCDDVIEMRQPVPTNWSRHITLNHWSRQIWGTGARAPSTSDCLIFSGHFRAAQTLTLDDLDSMWLPTPKEYIFATVYCMNFIIFLCVTVKYFLLVNSVPLLVANPGGRSKEFTSLGMVKVFFTIHFDPHRFSNVANKSTNRFMWQCCNG